MTKTYLRDTTSELKSLWSVWIGVLVFLTLTIPIWLFNDAFFLQNVAYLVIFTFLTSMLLPLILYIRYMQLTKGVMVSIDEAQRKIIFDNLYLQKQYSFSEVKSVRRVASYRAGQRKTDTLRNGEFFHFDVEFQNGECLIITCLMTREQKLHIGNIDTEFWYQNIAWIPIRGKRFVNLQRERQIN